MALNFRNTNDMRPLWLRMFLMGPSRSGKTVACASFPDILQVCPPNEDSWKTLEGRGVPYVVVGERDPLTVMGDMNELIDALVACYRGNGPRGTEEIHRQFGQTLVLESLSHYSDAVVSQLTVGGKIAPSQQTWGLLRTHMLSMRDRLFQLPMHIIFTSLEKITTDEKGAVTSAGPRITGAAGELLPSSCDMIGITEQTSHTPPRFQVHFRTYGHFKGGSRIAGMPQMSLLSGDGSPGNPTLFDQVMGFVEKSRASQQAT